MQAPGSSSSHNYTFAEGRVLGRRGEGHRYGCNADCLLEGAKTKAEFIAGYSRAVPWLESTLVDVVFLSYFLQGRIKRQTTSRRGAGLKGVSFREDRTGFIYEMSENPLKVARWVYEDVPLTLPLGFDVYVLHRFQGRSPRLISASAGRHPHRQVT